jgi:hypothetical protein
MTYVFVFEIRPRRELALFGTLGGKSSFLIVYNTENNPITCDTNKVDYNIKNAGTQGFLSFFWYVGMRNS